MKIEYHKNHVTIKPDKDVKEINIYPKVTITKTTHDDLCRLHLTLQKE